MNDRMGDEADAWFYDLSELAAASWRESCPCPPSVREEMSRECLVVA